MYSSLKNHSNNLQYCERFYYNAYQYYNDYERPQDYEDDLTKLFFKCKRKTIASITCYKNCQKSDQNRLIRLNGQAYALITQRKVSSLKTLPNSQQLINQMDQQRDGGTMEDFLNRFVQIYHQNNFSDFKNQLEQNKNLHKIIYFPQNKNFKVKNSSQKGKSLAQLDLIQNLLESFKLNTQSLKQIKESQDGLMDENQDIQNEYNYTNNRLAFEAFNHFQLNTYISVKDDKEKSKNNYTSYILFRQMIQSMFNQMCDSESWSHLILYIPQLPVLNYLFNPLISGIQSFLKNQQSLSKSDHHNSQQAERQVPKIVLINLDSRQSPQNVRAIAQCSDVGLMYVTIYNQALHHQTEAQEDELSEMISKLIIKQIDKANKESSKQKRNKGKNYTQVPKIFAFPLNSKYVRSSLNQKDNNDQNINCSLNGSSEDIMFLFDNVIFQEIRNFCPNIVLINYNGVLSINEQHFSKIIRTLSIISDHRIALFPNFCNLFENLQNQQDNSSLIEPDKQFFEANKYLDQDKVLKTKTLMEKYNEVDLDQIDIHNLFNNMAMFLKISSGTYSFQQRHCSLSSVFQKYETGLKYEYLQRLSQMDEFKYYSKFTSKHLKGQNLMKLMEKERIDCIQKNKDNAPLYKSLLNQAVEDFWAAPQSLPKNVVYKVQKLSKGFDNDQQKLNKYFQIKKDRLYIQTIKTQKIKKTYYVKGSNRENEPDNLFSYSFRQKNQQNQQILLEHYSQVFIHEEHNYLYVFVINVRDQDDQLRMMCGIGKINQYQILLSPIQKVGNQAIKDKMANICLQDDLISPQIQYVSYSHTFYKNKLFLFWPYEWNLKLEAQCLITGIQYRPKVVPKMVRINFNIQSKDKLGAQFEDIFCDESSPFIPRLYAGTWAGTPNRLYVFGGICDDHQDFEIIDSGAYIITIDKNTFKTELIKKEADQTKIRPKMNYVVQRTDQYTLLISGGHGREFTNFYNVFSYHSYQFDLRTHKILAKRDGRKVIQLPKPMFTRKQGRFMMSKNRGAGTTNLVKIEQRVSNQPKYKFIMCRKGFYSEKDNKNTAITFLDDDYTTTIYNKQNGFGNILGSNKTFENIYSQIHCSPEIYIWDKSRELVRIEILVEVSKRVVQYALKQFMFPNQDSLIAFCVHASQQKIYLLARSAIYTGNNYILYQGSLKNSQQIASQKQIRLKIFFQFKSSIGKLQQKALYCQDHRLMICGGVLNNQHVRQDYLLQRIKGKYKLKTINLSYPQKSYAVQMKNPYILQKSQNIFIMYTICLNEHEMWMIKMEEFNLDKETRIIKKSEINLNAIVDNKIYQIKPTLMKLKFLSISRYSKFSFQFLRGKIHALLIEMIKLENEVDLNDIQLQIKRILFQVTKSTYAQIESQIPQIYSKFKRFVSYIAKDKYENTFYVQKSILAWEIILIIVNYKIQQSFYQSLSPQERRKIDDTELFRFLIEDKSRPLTKYVALSEIGTTRLKFFQIKTRKPIISTMISTTGSEDQYGINVGEKNCNEIYFDQVKNYEADIIAERSENWLQAKEVTYFVKSKIIKNNP